jgi:hypothetical protein
MGNTIEDVVALGLVLLFFALVVALYFVPTIIAMVRRVPNAGPLIVVNVFLGWTVLGWVLAFAVAVREIPNRSPAAR